MTNLVGRETELDAVRAEMHRVLAGHGRTILVEGPPGIGKTCLLDVITGLCELAGFRVLRGAAEQLEHRLHFAAVGSCLRLDAEDRPAEVESVARLLRPARGAETPTAAELNRLVTAAILDAVQQWCAKTPVALLIDDIQWSDPATKIVLHRLGTLAADLPLLLVCARRPLPCGEDLTRLLASLHSRDAKTIALGELDADAAHRLVEQLVGGPPGATLTPVIAAAGGNPFCLHEVAAALDRDHMVTLSSGMAELADGEARSRLPRSLNSAIFQRLDVVSEATNDVLRMAAVLRGSFTGAELAAVTERPMLELSGLVQDAVAVGLLRETAGRLDFRHDLIREALLEDLPNGVRKALYSHVGERLATAGLPPERVAPHLTAGGTLNNITIRWLQDCADELITRAPEEATDLLDAAARQVGSAEPIGSSLRFQRTRALLRSGRAEQAQKSAKHALRANREPELTGPLWWLLTQAYARAGQLEAAVANAQHALATVALSPVEQGRFHGLIAQTSVMLGDAETAEAHSLRAIHIGGTVQDAYALASGSAVLSSVRFIEARFEEAWRLSRRSLAAWSGEESKADLTLGVRITEGMALQELDRLAEAAEALAAGLRSTEQRSTHQSWYRLVRAQVRFAQGKWDDSLADARAGLSKADRLGLAPALQCMAAIVAVHRDDPAPAMPPETPFQNGVSPFYDWLRSWARALVLERGGDRDGAIEACSAAFARHGWANRAMTHHLYPDFVRLAHDAARPDLIEQVRGNAERRAATTPTPWTTGIRDLIHGTAEGSTECLRAAADAFRTGEHTLLHGYAMEQTAVLLAQRGDAAAASDALGQAIRAYRRVGGNWDVDRADGRLRLLGVRRARGKRRGADRPMTGWSALTPSEQRVAALVVKGLGNAEIAKRLYISPRTVQTHVSNILHKLDVRSRVEIAVLAATQNPGEQRE
ncbi:AAA family ATPase [Saccharopolyspora sp. 5N102]|uniref:helix-turn-helix transcriptional regulator n=1 Tax=Saccharopolyspora sp. 5N102 TaxID=3375155 RepID=UPI0037AE9E90